MVKSGFFNAIFRNGVYDRTYNAEDYCDNLAVVIGNGVLRSGDDDLKVSSNGMNVTVSPGRGWINGHYYKTDALYTFQPTHPPTTGSRIDRIMLRLNTAISRREMYLYYAEGVPKEHPVPVNPTRNKEVYDLVLADVFVAANATGLVVTDRRSDSSLCGWVYSTAGDQSFLKSIDNSFKEWFEEKKSDLSSVTLFKQYKWKKIITSETDTIQFNIPQYDAGTCFVEVYINGMLSTNYSLNDTVIGFNNVLTAGTEVAVYCFKSLDGTGIMTVADEITQLQEQVSTIIGDAEYTYLCTGSNDNISLSQIAQAFFAGGYDEDSITDAASAFLSALGGNDFLDQLGEERQIRIKVVGRIGIGAPYAGNGSELIPYRYFSLGSPTKNKNIRLIFDFSGCTDALVICQENTYNSIFYGADLNIVGLKCKAHSYDASCHVIMIDSADDTGNILLDNCIMTVEVAGKARIAKHGTFDNCCCTVQSEGESAYCFAPASTGLIRLQGGEYRVYGREATEIPSSVIYVDKSALNAVVMAYGINCPISAKTGYSQLRLSEAYNGIVYINGVVSTLPIEGTCNEITGMINKNKA